MKKSICYHVFADDKDEYVSTLKEAKIILSGYKKSGEPNGRIYKLTSDITDDIDDEVEEEFVAGFGEFPY